MSASGAKGTNREVPIRLGRACDPLVVESLGRCVDEDGERELYVALVPSFDDWRRLAADPVWAATVEEPGEGFALFLACDATTLSAELIEEFAPIASTGVSSGSARGVRTASGFKHLRPSRHRPGAQPGILMSTWHDDEPLDDALHLFWDAFPAEGTLGGPARIGISVGSHEWVEEMRQSAADLLRGDEEPEQ